ncbi:MAG: hypothetical protein K8U57_15900 [Planctomycetes bacterium]|nr:hypothetical protein [Planctomycetota bacterium]
MSKKRKRAARKADKLNDLIIRWAKLRADLEAVEADTPARFLESNDVRHHFENARNGIEDTQFRIVVAYGAAAAHANS